VRLHAKPDGEPLLDWVRTRCYKELAQLGTTPEELSGMSANFLLPLVDSIGGHHVVWYMPLCVDCKLYSTYFARERLVVEVVFALDAPLGGPEDPLEAIQEVVYHHVLGSLRWH
jgi:hypothetical protein